MTDPGGGLGWRAAPHLRGTRGWGRVAEEADRLGRHRPLGVLLLPERLEAF